MIRPVPAWGNHAAAGVVDGVDLDAVATAVSGCGGVADLYFGPCGGVVSYLPGRQVKGVRVASDHVVISVRACWGIPATELARQIRAALAALVGSRRVDIVVADMSEPEGRGAAWTEERGTSDEGRRRPKRPAGVRETPVSEAAAKAPQDRPTAGARRDEGSSWTTSRRGDDVRGAISSGPIIPTMGAILPPSPLA
jgi:hypothetical protein